MFRLFKAEILKQSQLGYQYFYRSSALPQALATMLLLVSWSIIEGADYDNVSRVCLFLLFFVGLSNTIPYWAKVKFSAGLYFLQLSATLFVLYYLSALFGSLYILIPVFSGLYLLLFILLPVPKLFKHITALNVFLLLFVFLLQYLSFDLLSEKLNLHEQLGFESFALLYLVFVLCLYFVSGLFAASEKLKHPRKEIDLQEENFNLRSFKNDSLVEEKDELLKRSQGILAKELRREFFERLSAMTMIVALLCTYPILAASALNSYYIGSWFLLLCATLLSMALLLKSIHTTRHIYRRAFLVAFLLVVWCLFLRLGEARFEPFASLVASLIIFGVSSLPWSTGYFKLVLLLLTALIVSGLLGTKLLIFNSLMFALVLILSVKNFISLRVAFYSRVFTQVIFGWREVRSTTAVLDLFAWHLSDIAITKTVMLLFGQGDAVVIQGNKKWNAAIDRAYLKALQQVIDGTNLELGILHRKDLTVQLRSVLNDVCNHKLYCICFVRFPIAIGEDEELVTLIMPISKFVALSGLRRIFSSIVMASTAFRSWISSAKIRLLSSDLLLSTQQALSEREYEINQIVHHVNNVVQDIAIQCENLRGEGEGHDLASLGKIEASARNLSAEVSDVKLLKELLRIRSFEQVETINLNLIVEEIELFANHYSDRFGIAFRLEQEYQGDYEILVASREFLETALRLCVRIAAKRSSAASEFAMRVVVMHDKVSFYFYDSSEPLSEHQQENILNMRGEFSGEELDYLKAVVNLTRLSNGRFAFADVEDPFRSSMELSLPIRELSGEVTLEEGWILLLDDNSEVLAFYTRIVEALELSYHCASSVKEAYDRLRDFGRPVLIISDIQLPDGNGIDFLEDVRSSLNINAPVIVVSGDIDQSTIEAIQRINAARHLIKPVGRRRLFLEIKELLNTEK
jgi:CheY-like chemotaxis protein